MQWHFRLVALILGAGLSGYGVAAAAPDTILLNGRIFVGDSSQSSAQALAISGTRVIAVGNDVSIKAMAGPGTRVINLGGRRVIPGINDAHNHLYVAPPNTVTLKMSGPNPTWSEMQAAVARAAQTAAKGSILTGDFATALYFDPAATRAALDKIAPAHPVILSCITGHALLLNSAALKMLGIDEKTRDPAAGRFERGTDGKLSGVVREYATLQVNRKLAELTDDAEAIKQLKLFYSEAAGFGITSIQDMSDAFTPQRIVDLLTKSATPLRVRVMRMPLTTREGRDVGEGLNVQGHPSENIIVSGTKWMLDGTPLEGTLTRPDVWHAVVLEKRDRVWIELPLSFDRSEMLQMLRETLERKDQLMVHVSGYPSAAAMLGAMAETGGRQVWAGKRIRFEHGDGLFPDLQAQAKELGIVVVQNPSHFASGIGAEKAFPLKSLLAAGIPLALGSDGPLNPYLNIMFASQHPAHPSEAISREQAIIAYTRTAAYAEFSDRDKGTLEPGKLADLAVLSQDILAVPQADLPATRSVLTLVGGKVVFDAGELN